MRPERLLDPARSALVIVDMQRDFCAPGGFFDQAGHDVRPCTAVVARLRPVLARVRLTALTVVFTMTVRDADLPHRLRPSRHPLQTEDADAGTLGNARYARGAWGTGIVDDLQPLPADLVIEKARPSAFFRTSLEQELRRRDIDTVALAGVTTNCCVDTTARDASMRDFNVLTLADLTAAFGAEQALHEASLQNIERFFGVVASSDDLLAALPDAGAAAG